MDRISNLPSDVIDDIMKRLTLHEAARTSLLSRQWRYKWLSIPYLVFHRKFQEKLVGKRTAVSIIYQVLSLHKGCIVKFAFESDDCCPDVDHWLHLLSKHHIEELSLGFSYLAKKNQKIPSYLFSFGQLKHLKLANCNLKLPFLFKGFGILVELDLHGVLIEHAELSGLISKCPLLEHLSLKGDMFTCLTIDAPNLKSFFLGVCSEIPCVCLKNTSFLEEVTIAAMITCVEKETSKRSQINIFELLCQLSVVKKLTLCLVPMLCQPNNVVPLEIPDKILSQLSHLICNVPFQELSSVSSLVCLIGRATNLMSLEIRVEYSFIDDLDSSAKYLKKQRMLKHSLCSLKHVKIDNFAGEEAEMEFVKLILSAATSLVKLKLELGDFDVGTEEGYSLIRKMAKFRQADFKTKIVIEDGFSIICLKRRRRVAKY